MTPIQSVAMLGLAPLILLIVLLGLTSHRVGARALGTWLLAWSALLASGWLIAWVPQVPELRPVGFLFSSTVGPLMLAGAYRLGVPSVLGPAFRIRDRRRAHGSPSERPGRLRRRRRDRPGPRPARGRRRGSAHGAALLAMPIGERILGATFLVYSIAECLDARMRMLGEYDRLALPIWIAGGFPLFAAQTALAIHRLGRSVMEQEDVTHSFEERLKLITQATRDVVVEVDERGRITFLGPNADHLGLAPGGSLLGADIRDFYPADTAEPIARQLLDEGRITEDVVAASRPRPFPARTSAGGIRWYETELTSYRTADGALRVLGRLRDVTEQRAATKRRCRATSPESRQRLASLGSWATRKPISCTGPTMFPASSGSSRGRAALASGISRMRFRPATESGWRWATCSVSRSTG
ncbi:MAG: PAS domain-containing protein [Myxococcota bacterium]